jgi:hypothetical protein
MSRGKKFSRVFTGFDRNSCIKLGMLHFCDILMSRLEAPHPKHAMKRGNRMPAQHLEQDRGKPRKTFVKLNFIFLILKIRFLFHRKHTASLLQRLVGYCCLGRLLVIIPIIMQTSIKTHYGHNAGFLNVENSLAFSLQANYTEQETPACRRS